MATVAALRAAYPNATIEAVLPRAGDLSAALEGLVDRVSVEPFWRLRARDLLRLGAPPLAQLPSALRRAARRFAGNDLVYLDAESVTPDVLAVRMVPGRVLLHLHGTPHRSDRFLRRALARWSQAAVIVDSQAAKTAWALPADVPTHVVHEGASTRATPEPFSYDGGRPLRVLMLARLDPPRGQDLLLDAIGLLEASIRARLEVRLVGGRADEPQARALRDRMTANRVAKQVSLRAFEADPALHYGWADVVAVPWRPPGSPGRVVAEAMAFGRPVLASGASGMRELVGDGVTGWIVPPGDALALALRLRDMVEEPAAWRGFGLAARARFDSLFGGGAATMAIATAAGEALRRRAGDRTADRRASRVVRAP